MNIYDKLKQLRKQYLNDIDYEVKLSILSQIIAATFKNNDELPKIITFTFDCKIILKMERKWQKNEISYPNEVVLQVLSDLDLKFNVNYCHRCSGFIYSIEVNLCNIKKLY